MKIYNKKLIKLKEETIAYIEEGKGSQTILLIHGNMSGSLHWTPLIERLEDDFHIIALDLKGFGDSTYNVKFDHLHQQAHLVAEFCQKLNLKHLIVAGWSTGGGVSMSLKIFYPELVDYIIFVDSISYRGHPYYKRDEKGLPIVGATYKDMDEMGADRAQKLAIDCTSTKNYEGMERIWNLVIYTGNGPLVGEESKFYLNETFKQRCMKEAYWALSTYNISNSDSYYAKGENLVDKVDCPILMFWGENDKAIVWDPFTKENYDYFSSKNKLTFYKIPNCGHSPLIDQPDFLASKIKSYFKID